MAYSPISNTVPKYESGQTLKAYIAGTSTLLQMATASDGVTLVNHVVCNASGYPEVSSNVVIPHINAAYKLALYPTVAAAIANSGAIWTIDNLTPSSIVANISISGNTISSTNTNGDITLDPNGSGAINLSAAVVGSSSGTFATLSLTSAPAVSGYVRGLHTYRLESGGAATLFDVDANVTEATFESVGPTGSSATNIWSSMDTMLSGAAMAIISVVGTITSNEGGSLASLKVYARKTGDVTAASDANMIFWVMVDGNNLTSEPVIAGSHQVFVPLDPSGRFDITWTAANESAVAVNIYFHGFVN